MELNQSKDQVLPIDEQLDPSFFKVCSPFSAVVKLLNEACQHLACYSSIYLQSVDYYVDKGISVITPKLVEELKSKKMSDDEKINYVRGILATIKPVNKVG